MGNRALVVFESSPDDRSPGVYLHWNGGPESVYTFLDYMKQRDCRMADDPSYAAARLCQIVGNFMGGTLSLGVLEVPDLEKNAEQITHGDNGIYVVTKDGFRRFTGHWLSDEEIAQEIKGAKENKYNKDNGLFNAIAEKNDPFFNSESEDQTA